ncbi:MAG: class I SAM-dependent methyltransferase [Alphaproteobacteria bacterium]|nr:class I SAM-dependent methyltransferase [Alphaproteobacteria bacterium]
MATQTSQDAAPAQAGGAGQPQPDVDSSSDTYAKRFEGPAGRYLLSVQTKAIRRLVVGLPGKRVLDVGGGHAQVAVPLLEDGCDVTVLGSEEDAVARARRLCGDELKVVLGDLCNPPVAERGYDVVVAVRMISHVDDWKALIKGLCRASDDAVIVDFAIPGGSNALAPLLFGLKKGFEGDTRRFRVVNKRDIEQEFEANGFRVDANYGQFVLPMAVHRALKLPGVSRFLEGGLRLLGLASWIGTPVIARARRIDGGREA